MRKKGVFRRVSPFDRRNGCDCAHLTQFTPSSVANVKGTADIPKHNHAVVDLMTKLQTKSLIAQNLGNMELSAS